MNSPRPGPLIAIVLFGLGFTSVVALTFLPALLVTLLTVSNRLRNARAPMETASLPPP